VDARKKLKKKLKKKPGHKSTGKRGKAKTKKRSSESLVTEERMSMEMASIPGVSSSDLLALSSSTDIVAQLSSLQLTQEDTKSEFDDAASSPPLCTVFNESLFRMTFFTFLNFYYAGTSESSAPPIKYAFHHVKSIARAYYASPPVATLSQLPLILDYSKLVSAWGEPMVPASNEWVISFECTQGDVRFSHAIEFVIKEQGSDVDEIGALIGSCLLNPILYGDKDEFMASSGRNASATIWTVSFDSTWSRQIFAYLEYAIPGLLLLCHYDIPAIVVEDDDIELMFATRRLCLHPCCTTDYDDNEDSEDDEDGMPVSLAGRGSFVGMDMSQISLRPDHEQHLLSRLRPIDERFCIFTGDIEQQVTEFYTLLQAMDDSLEGDSVDNRSGSAQFVLDAYYIEAPLKIVDLGNSCWVHKHFTDDIQTRQYRAPEVIITAGYNTSADLWSFGCIIFELLTGDMLFDPHAGSNWDRDEDHLAMMIELVGAFPRKLAVSGKRSSQYFDRRGELKHIDNLKIWKLREVLVDKYKMSQDDADEISEFLSNILEVIQMEIYSNVY
jgi:hypothetical protein